MKSCVLSAMCKCIDGGEKKKTLFLLLVNLQREKGIR